MVLCVIKGLRGYKEFGSHFSPWKKCSAEAYLRLRFQLLDQCNSINYKGFLLHVFQEKNVYKKVILKNPKTLRKCYENLQPKMPELQFLKTLIFPRSL